MILVRYRCLLGGVVRFRRDRGRPALARSGPVASPGEVAQPLGHFARPPSEKAGTPARDHPARDQSGRYRGAASAHEAARGIVRHGRLRGRVRLSQAPFIFSCSACCRSRSFAVFPTGRSPLSPVCSSSLRALLWPVLELGSRLGQILFRRADAPPRLFAAREDLKQLAVESERQGALTSSERAMIHNVVDFRTVKMADVMVPRKQVVAARARNHSARIAGTKRENGHRPGARDNRERKRPRSRQCV